MKHHTDEGFGDVTCLLPMIDSANHLPLISGSSCQSCVACDVKAGTSVKYDNSKQEFQIAAGAVIRNVGVN